MQNKGGNPLDHKIYMKKAEEICDQLFILAKNNQTKHKTLIELYSGLLDKESEEDKYLILSYIPECLSRKGYEITNSEYFEIKKY